MKQLILFIIGIAVSLQLQAQQKFAITNATIYTMVEQQVIDLGTVLVDSGKITAVGIDLKIPDGYKVIDANKNIVTPGFMNAMTRLGLYENTLSGSHEDDRARGALFSAGIKIYPAINPLSTLIPITRIEGITRAAVTAIPSQTIFGGLGAMINLNDEDNIDDTAAFMYVNLNEGGADIAGGSRAAAWTYFKNAIRESKMQGSDTWGGDGKPILTTVDHSAINHLLKMQLPFVIYASRLSDINNVINFKDKTGHNVILIGAQEGWMVADRLAKSDIAVILDPSHNLPTSFATLGSTKANAKRLFEAGVKIAFTTFLSSSEDHNARLVPQFAGQAVAYGLPKMAAIEALTINPAQMFGLKNYGRILGGQDADLVIWSGDPLEVTSAPTFVMIKGQEITLESRQTKLRDRYLNLEGNKPFGFR